MEQLVVDPKDVIKMLGQKIGELQVELAMKDAAIALLQAQEQVVAEAKKEDQAP